MKRKTLKSIACATILALSLSVTACGSSDDAAKNTDDSSVEANVENAEDAGQNEDAENTAADADAEQNEDAENTAADADAEQNEDAEDTADNSDGVYASLEDYYNDPAVKSILDSSFESMSGEGMSLSVEAKDNVLTMTCKIEDSSLVVDGIEDTLTAGLDTSASQFEQVVASFDEAIGQSAGTCSFVVRYTGPDDTVLAEREFKAQ